MRLRRLAAGTATALLIGGLSLAAAPTAMAADYEASCGVSDSSADVSGSVGDTITVQLAGFDCVGIQSTGAGVVSWLDDYSGTQDPTNVCMNSDCNPANPWTVITITLQKSGKTTWTALQSGSGLTLNITVADAPIPIPAWVQAYGRSSADATCKSGWNPSWQKWAESVTGGWVCTRSIPSLG